MKNILNGEDEVEPHLLNATTLSEADVGTCAWDSPSKSPLIDLSGDRQTVEWRVYRNAGGTSSDHAPEASPFTPAWIPVPTQMRLHSGNYSLDFVVEEMARRQIGVGFMLLWSNGPDWGHFGYLGSSPTAFAYDPSTGDVVYEHAINPERFAKIP
jgi:hypothetical protein